MFATGLPGLSLAFFSAASILIAVPSAISVFAWIATIWLGRPVITTAFLFFASTIILFVIGGVSGFMTASVPADWELTDTYFVVAHLHYVLLGINVFPVMGATHFWFPKFTGRMMDERLGRWSFWTAFIGFNVAFLPMHLTGLWGMPRRVYTYPVEMGLGPINMVSTLGSFLLAIGFLLFFINVLRSRTRGAPSGDNPWDAYTLEWSTSSPPPPYNFAVIPTVASRHMLWEDELGEPGERSNLEEGFILDHGKEALATSALDAEPQRILHMPDDTIIPFLLAAGMLVLFSGLLLRNWPTTAIGAVICAADLVAWFWPRASLLERGAIHD